MITLMTGEEEALLDVRVNKECIQGKQCHFIISFLYRKQHTRIHVRDSYSFYEDVKPPLVLLSLCYFSPALLRICVLCRFSVHPFNSQSKAAY
jgi:hypothetical protein